MSYSGIEAKISLGSIGLMTDVAPDATNPAALVDATNVTFFNGKVQKAPGSLQWNATPVDSGIIACHYWEPDTVTYRMIAVTNTGNYYKGQDRVFSQIGSGLGVLNPQCVFAEGGQEQGGNPKKLFLFTGVGLPQVLTADGSSVHPIGTPSPDWKGSNFPQFGVVHRNQLWTFADQISYASYSLDHEYFAADSKVLVNPVFPGEGGNLLGAFDFKGILFCFKDGGFVYQLIDTDPSNVNWYWKKVASTFGLSAPNAICEVNDDMIAGNATGTLTSYASSLKLGGIEAGDMVQEMQFKSYFRGYVNQAGVRFQHVLHYPEKNLLFATYQNGFFTYNNTLLVMDYGLTGLGANSAGGGWRPSFWTKGTPQCLALYKDTNRIRRPMYGDNSGYLNLMDQVDRSEGGAGYTGSFQTIPTDFSWLDMSFSAKEKHFDWLAVHYIPTGAWNLSCDYFIDGRYIDTIQFSMQQYLRPQLGTLLLGTDRLGQFVPEETGVRKIYGSGRTFSAKFYNAGNNQNFQVSAITVGWRPGSEKAMNV